MHESRGHWPTECIFAFMHQFSSDQFVGLYDIPGYTVWRHGLDQQPIYDWHRKMLQTLQSRAPTERWLLKAPSHLTSLSFVFATYPDARVVVTHRDPLRVVGSLADMMATLRWMHSDHVDHAVAGGVPLHGPRDADGRGDRASATPATCPDDRIADVRYTDLVADPVGCVAGLYEQWGIELTGDVRTRPRGLRGGAAHGSGQRPRLPLRGHRARPGRAPAAGPALPGPLRRGLGGRGHEARAASTGRWARARTRVGRSVGQHPADEHVALEPAGGVEPVRACPGRGARSPSARRRPRTRTARRLFSAVVV